MTRCQSRLCFMTASVKTHHVTLWNLMTIVCAFTSRSPDVCWSAWNKLGYVIISRWQFVMGRDSAVSKSVGLVAEPSQVRGSGSCNAVMWQLVHSSIKKSVPDRTWWLWVRVMLCTFNGSMCCMLPWELRCVLGGNRSESRIIIL